MYPPQARRQTLSALDQNIPGGRKSMNIVDGLNRISLSRRTSLYAPAPTLKDPRRIREKDWKESAQKIVLRFLIETNYEKTGLSIKTLQQPTARDFQNVFTHIYGYLDRGHKFGGKFDEEVLLLVKALRYPFADQITKHSLMTVGAAHTWPVLLAMLVWMVELILCCQSIETGNDLAEEDDLEKTFSDWVIWAYNEYFLAGVDDVNELQSAVKQLFDNKNATTIEECHKLQEETDQITADIEQLAANEHAVRDLQQERTTFTSDLEKYQTYLNQLEQKRNKHAAQLETLRTEISEAEEQVTLLKTEKNELQRQVDAQEISPIDVERMNLEREQLTRTLESSRTRGEQLAHSTWEAEMILQRTLDAIEVDIASYNSHTFSIGLAPPGAEYAEGKDYRLVFDLHAPSVSHMLSLDLRNDIRPSVERLKENLKIKTYASEEEWIVIQKNLISLSETLGDKINHLADLKLELASLIQRTENEKESTSIKLEVLNNEITTLETDINTTTAETNQYYAESASIVKGMQQELESNMNSYEQSLKRTDNDVIRALGEMSDLKDYITAELKKVLTLTETQLSQVAEIS